MKKKLMLHLVLTGILGAAAFAAPMARAVQAPRRIEITAKRFSFDPGEITLKKGQPVVLVLKSVDTSHGIRIRDLNVDVKSGAGGTAEIRFTPNKTGDFVGHCSVFCGSGHGTMALTFHVVD